MLSHSDIFLEHLYPKVRGFMFITRIKTSEPRMEESGNSLFAIMKLQNHSCLQIFSPSCVASVLLVSLYLYISIVRVELFCVKGLKWWPCVVPCLDTGQCTMSPKGITAFSPVNDFQPWKCSNSFDISHWLHKIENYKVRVFLAFFFSWTQVHVGSE